MPDAERAVSKMRRVVRPGGWWLPQFGITTVGSFSRALCGISPGRSIRTWNARISVH